MPSNDFTRSSLIYYGDEAGLLGNKDPENRKTYPWGRENKEILSYYSFFGNFRKNEGVLRKGDFFIFLRIHLRISLLLREFIKRKK